MTHKLMRVGIYHEDQPQYRHKEWETHREIVKVEVGDENEDQQALMVVPGTPGGYETGGWKAVGEEVEEERDEILEDMGRSGIRYNGQVVLGKIVVGPSSKMTYHNMRQRHYYEHMRIHDHIFSSQQVLEEDYCSSDNNQNGWDDIEQREQSHVNGKLVEHKLKLHVGVVAEDVLLRHFL